MKVILFGASGFIGAGSLEALLNHPAVTEVVTVSRRPLTNAPASSKIRSVILSDFFSYPEDVVSQLATAEACIWCVGTYSGDEKVEVDFPKNFHNAMTSSPSWSTRTKEFRFVLLGGTFTEPDQEKSLWWMQQARRVRGNAQNIAISWNDAKWKSTVVRAGGVLPASAKQNWWQCGAKMLLGDRFDILIELPALSAVMVELALNSEQGKAEGGVVGNKESVTWGRYLLATKRMRAGDNSGGQ